MSLAKLSIEELLEQYEDMIRWYHYDPMGAKRPSKFAVDELKNEMRRRLKKGEPAEDREDLDRY